MKICFSFRCNSILIFTSFYNKVCRGFAYFNTKMSYLSDFKRTKSKTLRTASTGRMTNWKKPQCDPVQIIQTKDCYFKSYIIVNTATSYFFTNLRVIYFWNGHRERRSSHWHLHWWCVAMVTTYLGRWNIGVKLSLYQLQNPLDFWILMMCCYGNNLPVEGEYRGQTFSVSAPEPSGFWDFDDVLLW